MKRTKSKLSIHATTLRHLSSLELGRVHGGESHKTCINVTCTCPPTYNGCGTTFTDPWCV